jgi:hypothetical protein
MPRRKLPRWIASLMVFCRIADVRAAGEVMRMWVIR